MWDKIFRYFVILQPHIGFLLFVIVLQLNKNSVSGIIIEELCVPHQISELERYLEELDIQEMPVSNTATYFLGVNDDYAKGVPELSQYTYLNNIELSPFGALPIDWKRLRVLYDLLILPEDEKLKSKLLIVYQILIAANIRIQKSIHKDNQSANSAGKTQVSTTEFMSGTKTMRKDIGDEIIDGEEKRDFPTTQDFGKTKILQTTVRQRIQRSTYHSQNYGSTDSTETENGNENISSSLPETKTTPNYFEGFSEPPELLDSENENFEMEGKSHPDFKDSIPQLEEIERIFKDSEFGQEVEESFGKVTEAKNYDFEKTTSTDSNLEKMVTEVPPNLSKGDYEHRNDHSIKIDEYGSTDRGEKAKTDFENEEIGEHVASETINEMGSDLGGKVTTEEIKPDLTNDDFETTSNLSEPFTSLSSLPIDQKTSLNFGERSSTPWDFPTPSFVANGKTEILENETGLNYSTEKIETSTSAVEKIRNSGSYIEEDFLNPKKNETGGFSSTHSIGRSSELNSMTETTRNTSIPGIVESFSNSSGSVETVFDQNSGEEIKPDFKNWDVETTSTFSGLFTSLSSLPIDQKTTLNFGERSSTPWDFPTPSFVANEKTEILENETGLNYSTEEIETSTSAVEKIRNSGSYIEEDFLNPKKNETGGFSSTHSIGRSSELNSVTETTRNTSIPGIVESFSNSSGSVETVLDQNSGEEIKPDFKNWDFETSSTFSGLLTSLSSLPIDQKTSLNFGERSSTPRDFPTPSFVANEKTEIFENETGLNYSTEKIEASTSAAEKNEIPGSYVEENFSNSKKNETGKFSPTNSIDKSTELYSLRTTTRKTLILKIGESFSNIPKRVEIVSIKKSPPPDISRVHDNLEYGKDSMSNSLPTENIGSKFYDRRNYQRADRKSAKKYLRNNLSNFLQSPSSKKHEKRGGQNTDSQKLYRWFYRGDQGPEKSDPRTKFQTFIKCQGRKLHEY